MTEILEDLNREGITLLVVTHDADMGERAARQIRMVDGAIASDSAQDKGQQLMRLLDLLRFTLLALRRQRFRSIMLLTAVGLGVGAVVVLTALGEGARGYVMGEFAFLGKDTVVMYPGRKETTGGMPPITGAAARAITLEEVAVLGRTVPGVTSWHRW